MERRAGQFWYLVTGAREMLIQQLAAVDLAVILKKEGAGNTSCACRLLADFVAEVGDCDREAIASIC